MGAHMAPDHDVFQGAHGVEQADILERTRNAGAGHLVHRRGLVLLAVELKAPGIRGVQPRHHIKEGGLAGAIGPDQAVDFPGLDTQAHVIERSHAAKLFIDLLDLQ